MKNRFLETNFFKGKKVLLTGHTGFKGSWLSLLLNELGAQVYGYALRPPTSPNLYELIQADDFVTSCISDIRNFDRLCEFLEESQPEIVIHMAAQSLVRSSYQNPRMTFDVNVLGTVNLLEAARLVGSAKVVLNVTTDKCYENNEQDRAYHEGDRLGGYDPYSNSKACSELVTSSYRNSFFDKKVDNTLLATARSGNIFGGGDWSKDRLIPDFVRSLVAQEDIVLRNPNAIRPWQYILDSLFGYLNLIEKLYVEGSEYASSWNFGPKEENHRTVEWIIDQLCQKWVGQASYSIEGGANSHEARFLKLDSSKAKNRLGWSNVYSLEQGLNKTADWYRCYLDGEKPREISLAQINEFMKFHVSNDKQIYN